MRVEVEYFDHRRAFRCVPSDAYTGGRWAGEGFAPGFAPEDAADAWLEEINYSGEYLSFMVPYALYEGNETSGEAFGLRWRIVPETSADWRHLASIGAVCRCCGALATDGCWQGNSFDAQMGREPITCQVCGHTS